MRTRPFFYLKEAVLNLWKNKTNTAGSIFIMSFTFAILGIVFMVVMNINALIKDTQSSFDEITLFLLDELEASKIETMFGDLRKIDGVKDVVFEDKEEAFRKWKEDDWGDEAYILDGIGESPLPNAFHITITDISLAGKVVEELKKFEGVEDIKYYKEEVRDMLVLGKIVAKIGLGIIAVLLVLCFFVISNTIKIAVNSRQKEINIMKYVGAKNRFIRGPFIMEGLLVGLISSAFSSLIVYFLYRYVISSFGFDKVTVVDGGILFSAVDPAQLMNTFVFVVLVLGLGIGCLGAISSTRKHLKV